MIGRKDNTLPMPANAPSMTSEWTTGLIPYAVSARSVHWVTASIPTESTSLKKAPMTPKVSQNTSSMIHKKMGIASHLLVNSRSICTDR